MKRLVRIIVPVLVLTVIAFGQARDIAFLSKVSGQVSMVNAQNQTVPVTRPTRLQSGVKIMTGSNGLAVIMYLDDKSIVRVQKNTTLTIGGDEVGTGTNRAIDKQIDMQFGKLRAQVAEQRRGAFQIATPTSVASVKGTDFWTTTDPVFGDIFLGVSGSIEVENLVSGGVITVGGGQVGTSTPEGETSVATYVLLVGELLSASEGLLTMEPADGGGDGPSFNGQIQITDVTSFVGPAPVAGATATVSGTLNDDGSIAAIQIEVEDAGGEAGDKIQTNELRIQLEDADGNIKEVIIIYQ